MSEKAGLFRSLLLEPLESRAVFSVDGLDIWQFIDHSPNLEFDPMQPAQFPSNESAKHNLDIDRSDRSGINFAHSPRGTLEQRHHQHDEFDMPLPSAEGEGRPLDNPAPGSNSNLPTHLPNQPSETQVVVVVETLLTQTIFSEPRDVHQIHGPRFQTDSSNSSNLSEQHAGFAPTFDTQNAPAATPVVSANNLVTQANLAALNLSTLSTETATFDFSPTLGGSSETFTPIGFNGQSKGEFQLTKPGPTKSRPIVPASILDRAIIERSVAVESLENLLSDLAENHRRGRIQSGFDVNQPNSRSERDWRPEPTVASVEMSFADGGMIALALNRDITLSELEDISEDARSENKAWIANVGILRAFENGAVAATEYSGLTNRIGRNTNSNSTVAELTESEEEVANTQLHPLLASTSAALGAMMFGLRRIRKSTLLMFTTGNR